MNLLAHQAFSDSRSAPYEPNTVRTPVYPFYLAALYAIFGCHPFIAILLQTVIGSLSCLLVFKTGKILFQEKTALAAGLLVAFEYTNVIHANLLLSDTIFLFLFSVGVFFLAKFFAAGSNNDLIRAALFLGLSALCRPASVYFFVFLIGVFYLQFRRNLRLGLRKYAIFTLTFMLTIAPWMIRNYVVADEFLISRHQQEVLRWNMSYLSGASTGLPSPQTAQEQNSNTNAVKTAKENQSFSITARIAHAAVLDAKKYMYGMISFFMIPGSNKLLELLEIPNYRLKNIDASKGLFEKVKTLGRRRSFWGLAWLCFCTIYLLVLYATAGFGIYASLKRERVKASLLIVIISYFAIASAPFSSTDRYRLPIMPYVILFSCCGAFHLQSKFREKFRH